MSLFGKFKKRLFLTVPLLGVFAGMSLAGWGCATVYRHQINNIDTETTIKGSRFEIILSERNVNMMEAELGSTLSKKMVKDKLKRDEVNLLRFIASHFSLVHLGENPVFIEDYADKLAEMILRKCPNGNITGLTSTKERASYKEDVQVGGAIVKVTGYCWKG